MEIKEVANKKNNIKNPTISNAKNQQYKTAISSFKTANDILNTLQINKIEEKLKLIEDGLISSDNTSEDLEKESSEKTLEKIEKLTELTEQLSELKK